MYCDPSGLVAWFIPAIPKAAKLVCGLLGIGATGVVAIETVVKPVTSTKTQTATRTKPTPPPPPPSRLIYRYGYAKEGITKLVPTHADATSNTGLSFSLIPKADSFVTTIEAVNRTGVLMAVNDHGNHVAVRPIGGTTADWRRAGTTSIWTVALISAK
jgi:hypothetical protein